MVSIAVQIYPMTTGTLIKKNFNWVAYSFNPLSPAGHGGM